MPPRARLVESDIALRDCVHALRDAPRLGVDTEGNGMHAFATRLCAIQVCAAEPDRPADDVFVIDTLAMHEFGALGELIAACDCILHDLAFDVRLLRGSGISLMRVIDTSVHARLLGVRETGLASLLLQRFGLQLEKKHQHDDWSKRPYTESQLNYLAADVAFLGPLAAALGAEAEARAITEEIAEETRYALANAKSDTAQGPAYARMKGVREMRPAGRAIVRELVQARDEIAASLDLPSGRVLPNAAIIALARKPPRNERELLRHPDVYGTARQYVKPWWEAIERAIAAGDVPEAERSLFAHEPIGRDEITRRRAREKALVQWRATESAARGVDPQVVLPGHAVADLVALAPTSMEALATIAGLGTARIERYGATLLQLLSANA